MTVPQDRWHRVAIPLLQAVAELPAGTSRANLGALGRDLGFDPIEVAGELEALIEAGYLRGSIKRAWPSDDARPWFYVNAGLAERGLRLLGYWPAEDPYEALLQRLEQRIDEEPEPERKSRLQRLRDGLISLGRDVGSDLIASVLMELGRGL
jgi:hypothetical protein